MKIEKYNPTSFAPIFTGKPVTITKRGMGIIAAIVLLTNLFTFSIMNIGKDNNEFADNMSADVGHKSVNKNALYLSDKAGRFVSNVANFESKVKRLGRRLQVPPEWLMAVMFFESRFDASAINGKGTGATGIFQWKPEQLDNLGTTPDKVRNMSAVEQLALAEKHFNDIKTKYRDFESLTDLYLATFYPEALSGDDYCFTLYQEGQQNYERFNTLDTNNDGRITVKDLDDRMKKQFATAYMKEKSDAETWWNYFWPF